MSQMSVKLKNGNVVGKWKIEDKLGEGAFGAVYLVERVGARDGKKYCAMKTEPRAKCRFDELLRMEVYVLKKLRQPDKRFFCTVYDNAQTPQISYVVMTLMYKPLDDLRRKLPKRRFSANSCLKIGIQMMSAFSKLHHAGFVHRDVKPANIAPGFKRRHQIYLYDFGLARGIFEEGNGNKLRAPRKRATFRGTYRYCSLDAQKGKEQGRVDDLWGLLYSLIELVTGRLPWSGLHPKENEHMKEVISDSDLFKNCPPSFLKMKKYLRPMGYNNEPTYTKVQLWMKDDIDAGEGSLQTPFEWEGAADKDSMIEERILSESQAAHREPGDDTIRSLDNSILTDEPTMSRQSTLSSEDKIEDTLDDVPDDIMNKSVAKKGPQPKKPP